MLWAEQIDLRTQNSKTYRNTADRGKRLWSGSLGPIHYKSDPDSNVFDSEINCEPRRVNSPLFDGWSITENGWHYALGQPAEKSDGWVGFGGRGGSNWFLTRLARVGYLHWPTREWEDIGGVPTYLRDKLSSYASHMSMPTSTLLEGLIAPSCKSNWDDLWTTPGGGSLSLSLGIHGGGLKEDITINQAARDWIKANKPPSTPADKTWFGFVFQVDWSDIPKISKMGSLIEPWQDFNDDQEGIELRDDLSRLLAFLPISDVRVNEERQPLRKRFWNDPDGNHYLLLGIRADVLNGMPDGDLIFDPTLIVEPQASADDAREWGGGSFDSATTGGQIRSHTDTGSTSYRCVGVRFPNVAIRSGWKINLAYAELYCTTTISDSPRCDIYGNDVDDANDFVTEADIIDTRVRTTASVEWVDSNVGVGYQGSTIDITSIIEEIIAREGWVSGNAMALLYIAKTDFDNVAFSHNHYDFGPGDLPPRLTIVYQGGVANRMALKSVR